VQCVGSHLTTRAYHAVLNIAALNVYLHTRTPDVSSGPSNVMMWAVTVSLVLFSLCSSALAEDEVSNDEFSCYSCNSQYDDHCYDYFDYKENNISKHFSVNCRKYFEVLRLNTTWRQLYVGENFTTEAEDQKIPPADGAKFFCRKTIMSLTGLGKKKEDYRIIRRCAWTKGRYAGTDRECYHTATNLYTTTNCHCDGNNCNPASALTMTVLTLLLPLLGFTLL